MVRFIITCIIVVEILVVYVFPFIYALKSDSFKRAVFFIWGLLIIWGFLMFLIPLILYGINEYTVQIAKEAFPEMIGFPMVLAMFLGWLWAFMITAIAQGARKLHKKSNPEIAIKKEENSNGATLFEE